MVGIVATTLNLSFCAFAKMAALAQMVIPKEMASAKKGIATLLKLFLLLFGLGPLLEWARVWFLFLGLSMFGFCFTPSPSLILRSSTKTYQTSSALSSIFVLRSQSHLLIQNLITSQESRVKTGVCSHFHEISKQLATVVQPIDSLPV